MARARPLFGKRHAPAAILLTSITLALSHPPASGAERAQSPPRERAPESAGRSKVPIYGCKGFIAPLRDGMQVEKGRTLPLKATLVDQKGSPVEAAGIAAPPRIELVQRPGTPQESDVTDEVDAGDFGSGIRFVFREAYWKFDLPTDDFSGQAAYRVRLVSGDARRYRVEPVCALRFLIK